MRKGSSRLRVSPDDIRIQVLSSDGSWSSLYPVSKPVVQALGKYSAVIKSRNSIRINLPLHKNIIVKASFGRAQT